MTAKQFGDQYFAEVKAKLEKHGKLAIGDRDNFNTVHRATAIRWVERGYAMYSADKKFLVYDLEYPAVQGRRHRR